MKNIILFLLAAVMLSFYAEAATNPSADVATDLSPAVREV